MSDKLLTLADPAAAQELSDALFIAFKQRLAEQGFAAVDCYPDGRPAPVQVTTRLTAPPPDVVDPVTRQVTTPSDPRSLVIDARCEALQGRKADVRGKQITIDVSAAVPWQPGTVVTQPMTLAARTKAVSAHAASGGAALAGAAAAMGLSGTMMAAGGALGVLAGAAVGVFRTRGK